MEFECCTDRGQPSSVPSQPPLQPAGEVSLALDTMSPGVDEATDDTMSTVTEKEGLAKLQDVAARIPSGTMAMALAGVGYGMLWHNVEMKLLDEKSHEKHLNPMVNGSFAHDPHYSNPYCTLDALHAAEAKCKWGGVISNTFMVISLIYFTFYLIKLFIVPRAILGEMLSVEEKAAPHGPLFINVMFYSLRMQASAPFHAAPSPH